MKNATTKKKPQGTFPTYNKCPYQLAQSRYQAISFCFYYSISYFCFAQTMFAYIRQRCTQKLFVYIFIYTLTICTHTRVREILQQCKYVLYTFIGYCIQVSKVNESSSSSVTFNMIQITATTTIIMIIIIITWEYESKIRTKRKFPSTTIVCKIYKIIRVCVCVCLKLKDSQ